MTMVMPGGAHGHNEVMMMYVSLMKGCQLIWGEAVHIFSGSYNAHVLEGSPHGHVSHIANNVYQTLINPRYKSPLFDCQNGMFGQM
jgi:hypothetical protein